MSFAYGAVTLFGGPFLKPSTRQRIDNFPACAQRNPTTPNAQGVWFRLFPFRSPLLRESHSLSFPRGTEMVHFPRFALSSLKAGLPHSEISGLSVSCTYPERFAVDRVLLRLLVPRHPP